MRAGTSLAVAGAPQVECIVTGGKGTIALTHKGQTYYVCCSGCKGVFDDDPDAVIAENFTPGLMSAMLTAIGFRDQVSAKELQTLVNYLAEQ